MSIYKLKSITKISPPEGVMSKRWYQYIIENDLNTITSIRSGSEKEVRDIAVDSVKRLNEKYSTRGKIKHYNNPVYENPFTSYLWFQYSIK